MTTGTAFITGLGAFLPNAPVENDRMEAVLGRINGYESWSRPIILESTRIRARHYALDPETGRPTHTNAEMTAMAVRSALVSAGYDLSSLDLLACGTTTPDQLAPGHAAMTAGVLNAHPLEAVSFSGICTSSMAALRYAYLSVLSGQRTLAAATGSEITSALIRASRFNAPEDEVEVEYLRKDPILGLNKEFFRWVGSDGAGCAVLSPVPRSSGDSLQIDWIDGACLAGQFPACMYIGAEKDPRTGALKGWMQEPDLRTAVERNYFVITQDIKLLKDSLVPAGIGGVLKTIVDRRGLKPDMYDWFLPHLSTFYFKDLLVTALDDIGLPIPPERWFTNLDCRGNTGSAALLIMLEEAYRTGLFTKGQRILCGVPESGRFSFYFVQLSVV